MAKVVAGSCLAILGVAVMLAGCSPAPMMERLPSEMGGLPAGAPAAPATSYRYPAVHDTPPPRVAAPLTDEQQLEMEKQLQAARKRQENKAEGMKKTPLDVDSGSK